MCLPTSACKQSWISTSWNSKLVVSSHEESNIETFIVAVPFLRHASISLISTVFQFETYWCRHCTRQVYSSWYLRAMTHPGVPKSVHIISAPLILSSYSVYIAICAAYVFNINIYTLKQLRQSILSLYFKIILLPCMAIR